MGEAPVDVAVLPVLIDATVVLYAVYAFAADNPSPVNKTGIKVEVFLLVDDTENIGFVVPDIGQVFPRESFRVEEWPVGVGGCAVPFRFFPSIQFFVICFVDDVAVLLPFRRFNPLQILRVRNIGAVVEVVDVVVVSYF
jgi:hypothetical protein